VLTKAARKVTQELPIPATRREISRSWKKPFTVQGLREIEKKSTGVDSSPCGLDQCERMDDNIMKYKELLVPRRGLEPYRNYLIWLRISSNR
jgi:hypothetical protein